MAVAIAFKVSGFTTSQTANGSTSVTGLTTSAASLIVITASIGNNTASTVSGVTVNGNAATFCRRQVMPDGTSNTETWAFWSSAALSSVSVVVSYSCTAGAGDVVLVSEATGTDASSVGNVNGANGTSATTAAAVTCSATGSVMFGGSFNFANAEVAGANTTVLATQGDLVGDFGAASFNSQATTSGTSYTVTTTHTSAQWAINVVEIKPASSGTSAALTGSAASAGAGTVAPNTQHALTGSSATASAGTMAHSATLALAGSAAAASPGSVTVGSNVTTAITGSSATASIGSVTQSRTVAASGSSTTASAGNVFPHALTGVAATSASGSVLGSITIALTGIALAASAGTASIPVTTRYPLVHSGRKTFDQQGNPFRIKGRTNWGFVSLTPTLRASFIANTLSYGFNAIECQIPTHLSHINNVPQDGAGNLPFLKRLDGATWTGALSPFGSPNTESPDFTTPNPTYWAFVDALVQDCYNANILLLMFPSYHGDGSGDGWLDELNANIAVNGDASINTYGAFVANRYKTFPHIVWMTAGDTASGFDAENDLIVGLQSVSGQLSNEFSSERAGGQISTDGVGALGASTTLNGAYDWATVITQCQRAYSFSSSMFGYLLEEPYDEEGTDGTGVNSTFSTQPVRRYEWWGWLNAIGGYVAGNGYVWRDALTGTPLLTDDYRNHLDTQNTQDLGRLNAFMELWPNTNDLVPGGLGGMRTLVVSGAGTIDTGNFVCAAQTSGGDLMIAYTPPGGSGSFSLDLRSMAGRPIRARWWDPTAATYTTNASAAGTFTLANTASSQAFTAPSSNAAGDADWVLVLEAQPAVSLTGNAMAGSPGTAAPASSLGATGSSATSARGTVAPAMSFAMTGVSATTAAGSATQAHATPTTGASAATSTGAAAANITVAITGSALTSAPGTVSASSPGTAAITGSAGTSAPGTIGSQITASATGASTASAPGATSPGIARAVSGGATAASSGSIAAIAGTVPAPGASSASSPGTASAAITIALSGASATIVGGTVTPSVGAGAALTGVGATCEVGTMTVTMTATVALTGVSAAGAAGNVFANLAKPPKTRPGRGGLRAGRRSGGPTGTGSSSGS